MPQTKQVHRCGARSATLQEVLRTGRLVRKTRSNRIRNFMVVCVSICTKVTIPLHRAASFILMSDRTRATARPRCAARGKSAGDVHSSTVVSQFVSQMLNEKICNLENNGKNDGTQ